MISDLQQFAGFVVPGGPATIFAGTDPSQTDELPPTERFASCREFFGHCAVVLLGMQRAIFTGGILEQHVEDRPRVAAAFADAMHCRSREGLIAPLNGLLR